MIRVAAFAGRYLVRLKDLPETLTVSRSYAHLFKQMQKWHSS